LVVYTDHRAFPDEDRLSRRRGVRGEAEHPGRSRAEAVRRARTKVRRLARSEGFRYMVTLTFPGVGVHYLEDAKRSLAGWMHGRRHDGRGGARHLFAGRYVAVPERHRSHGWHWHVLTDRRIPVEALRASWSAHNGARSRTHHKHFGDARAASAYAAKYVSKAMEGTALGRHRYLVGDGCGQPVPDYELVLAGDVYEAVWLAVPVGVEPYRVCKVTTGAGPPAAWAGW
jgi:hypothetical protein